MRELKWENFRSDLSKIEVSDYQEIDESKKILDEETEWASSGLSSWSEGTEEIWLILMRNGKKYRIMLYFLPKERYKQEKWMREIQKQEEENRRYG